MSYVLVKESNLTDIADAIRGQNGTEATYKPSQMAEAIDALPGAEGVFFIDHDETLIYSYTWDEVSELSELPALPEWTNETVPMTCDGWNWTLDYIKLYGGGSLYVAPEYVPSDRNTHFGVHVNSGNEVSIGLLPTVDGGCLINWGDESTEYTAGTEQAWYSHTYYSDEDTEFDITVTVRDGSCSIIGDGVLSGSDGYSGNGAMYQPTTSGLTSDQYSNIYRRSQILYLYVGDGITEIGSYAFMRCYTLYDLTCGSITNIGAYAFYNTSLDGAVALPSTLTDCGSYSFAYCRRLRPYLSYNTEANSYAFHCNHITSNYFAPIYVAYIASGLYGYGGAKTVRVPGWISAINSYAFQYNTRLKRLEICSGVETINSYAFRCCYGLEEVDIGDGLKTIGNYGFYYCHSLKELALPESTTSIGTYCFAEDWGLRTADLCGSLSSIPEGAFKNCYAMKKVSIPGTVTEIGTNAFYYNESLYDVDLPSEILNIGDYAFYCCFELTISSLPDAIESIGAYAFCYTNIKELNIPSSVKEIGSYAFAYELNLKTISFHGSLESLGNYSFAYCSTLECVDGLNVPEDSTCTYVFRRDYKLTTLTNVGEIASSIYFYNCPLSYESALNLLNALVDENDGYTAGTIGLNSDTYDLLSEEDIAIATDKGWSIAYSS